MPTKIITKRGNELGSLPSFSKSVKVAYVGESYGENIIVRPRTLDVQNEFSYQDSTTLQGSLSFVNWNNNLVSVTGQSDFEMLEIYTDPEDKFNVFINGLDYNYDDTLKAIIFTDNPITPPELEVETLLTGGSGLSGRAYRYKIAAYGYDGTGSTSLLSSQVLVASESTSTVKHKLTWTKIPHAAGYIIYDSTANMRVAIIANPNTTSYTRTTGSGTSVTLPTVATAFRKPVDVDLDNLINLYFDYQYNKIDYTVNNFTSLNQVQSKHGVGSPLTNMARIAFQNFNVPELYAVATTSTNNQTYIDAIDKLKNIEDIQYVTALKSSDTVIDYVVTHATNQSTEEEQKERFGVINVANSVTSVGDENTSGTIRYKLASFLSNMRAIVVVANGNKVYMNQFQESDGSFTENKLVENHYLAGAVAAAIVTADDVATSIIGRQISGFNFLNNPPWIDSVEQDKIESSGGLYIKSKNGTPVAYNDITNDTSTTENSERVVLSAEDEMRRRLRTSHSQYLGRKITQGLRSAIYSTTGSVLKQMVADVLIEAFNESSLEVNQDDIIKTKIIVVFRYTPIYTLRELEFSYSFDL